MSWHTKEPWVVFPRNSEIYIGIGEETGDGICDGGYGLWRDGPERKANAERIVACVNAMAGIDDPVEFMQQLRDVLRNLRMHAHLNRKAESLATVDININLTRDAAALLSRMGGGE